MSLFTIHLDTHGEHHAIEYDAIHDCFNDTVLANLLDADSKCEIWIGSLRLTGKAIDSPRQLREALGH